MFSSIFSHELDYLVNKQRHEDRLRELERGWLIQTAGLQQSGNEGWLGKSANWIRAQLMAWGSKIHHHYPAHHQVLSRRR